MILYFARSSQCSPQDHAAYIRPSNRNPAILNAIHGPPSASTAVLRASGLLYTDNVTYAYIVISARTAPVMDARRRVFIGIVSRGGGSSGRKTSTRIEAAARMTAPRPSVNAPRSFLGMDSCSESPGLPLTSGLEAKPYTGRSELVSSNRHRSLR